jgi:hypothetical protein
VLEILTPGLQRLAYNDDAMLDGLNPLDAALVRLPLPEAGQYTIRVNSFNGASIGEVEVLLMVVEPLATETADDTIRVTLHENSVYTYPLEVTAGEAYTITALDPKGVLDAVLSMRDTQGNQIAHNDDHRSGELTLNIFDAKLTFTAPSDGKVTLELREFLGRGGTFEIRIARED